MTGVTSSTDFPTQSPLHGTYGIGENGLCTDAFVPKLAPGGNGLVYSTYLGGGARDRSLSFTVDGAGSAVVAGATSSTDFPVQSAHHATMQGVNSGFVVKLAPDGNTLDYSTLLGGAGGAEARDVALDGAGAAYITGAAGPGFPTARGCK